MDTSSDSSPQSLKRHLSILIVDDEKSVVDLLTIMLQSLGHEVVAKAHSGADAIRLASEHQPDLIILDISMPDMDGLDVAEKILAERSVPIIIGTGVTREEFVDRASRMNIQSYLIKPFRKEQLQSSIRLAMVRHHNAHSSKVKIEELTNELAVTKAVDRAVELLISKFGIDRTEAMEKIEAAAKVRSCSIAEAAKAIGVTLAR
jgi:response regulator NasT